MSSQAVSAPLPMPLTSEEIKRGIAMRLSLQLNALTDAQRTELRDAIWKSLNLTCSLNSQSYSKFGADWWIEHDTAAQGVSACWWIDYELDDYGRVTRGGIGGKLRDIGNDFVRIDGSIEFTPPDKFRRETDQPIPQPQVIQKKNENQIGITRSVGHPKKVRQT